MVIGDFGCATARDDPALTIPDNPIGPIHHLAPEIAAGDWERVDVYYLYLAQTMWRLDLQRDRTQNGHRSWVSSATTMRVEHSGRWRFGSGPKAPDTSSRYDKRR
jgi:hypothetical protein